MGDFNSRIAELQNKIEKELKIKKAGELLKTQVQNDATLSHVERSILDSEERLKYLRAELDKMTNPEPRPRHSSLTVINKADFFGNSPEGNTNPSEIFDAYNTLPARPKRISGLDYSISESGLSPEKISHKIHDITFKLDVEMKIKNATSKMVALYEKDPSIGDKKNRIEIQQKFQECNQKINLLKQALQKYQSLYVEDGSTPSEPLNLLADKKKGIYGILKITVNSARYIPHIGMFDAVQVVIKIDGNVKASTRYSRTLKWNEKFDIEVDKGVEVEVAVYDKSSSILSLIWFRVADIPNSEQPPENETKSLPSIAESIHSEWYDLETSGQICLGIQFVRTTLRRKPSKLGRQRALRKRKGQETQVVNGHKLRSEQFYQIVRCAVCSEVLFNGQGCQCEDCKFVCHHKCKTKVLTKCISKASGDEDASDFYKKINHRIPHRFEKATSLGPTWCCHCGMMMSFGKKKIEKCIECGTTCHTHCSVFVPDFCGLPMDRAHAILASLSYVDRERQVKVVKRPAEPIQSIKPEYVQQPLVKPQTPPSMESPPKMSIDEFHFIAVLGKGNFGKVMLSEHKKTKKLFAIKVLKKEFIIENDEMESTHSEKRVFLAANDKKHPFLVGLYSCFQSETRIYFVMQYVSGGDLMWHIQHEQFSEKRAKFYACEVLLALEHFHDHGIIYRDLKLDNILLGLDGHIKVADYGLCKENMWYRKTTNTFCGTPEFMAPEILLEQNYGKAVDWWAFGVLVYELLLGQSPFRGDDEDEIFEAILEDEVLYPVQMPRDSVSLIQGLLCRDVNRRLGAGPDDAKEIKDQPYFKDINWDDFLEKKVTPPFVPILKKRTDVSNFDEEFTREPPILTPLDNVLDPSDQAWFKDFTYVADWESEMRSSVEQLYQG